MIAKATRYSAAKFGWALLSAGTVIAVYSGQAEPLVSTSQLPRGPFYLFGAVVATVLPGLLLISRWETKSWETAGRRANLTPAGRGGFFGMPDLTGTVNGRTVRARVVKRKGRSSGEGSSTQRFTVVEADLNRPAEEGVLVSQAEGGRTSGTPTQLEIDPANADVTDDRLAAVGSSESFAQAVLSGRSRNALLAMDEFELVFVGDAAEAVSEGTPDVSDSRLGSFLVDKAAGRIPGDAEAVSIETKGLLLDSERLERQVEAVAAVADAFEEVRASA